MQKGTYDRRTKEEKVAPAIDLLDSVCKDACLMGKGGINVALYVLNGV